MQPSLLLAIIDSDSHSRNAIEAVIKTFVNVGVLATAADFQEGMKKIQAGNPQVVILDVKDIEEGVKETAFIMSHLPHTTVIVTATDKNPDWIISLMRAGASEYLTKPVVVAELVEAVKRVMQLHARTDRISGKKGATISVYNPSAGTGTTTIAVNLAATLAANGKKVALIDLNLCSSDVATFLDITPRYTLSSIMSKSGQVDASFLRSVIVPHSSGVHVLNGPVDLVEADKVPPERLQEVIVMLQTIFEYTIIDTGGQLFGCNLATFDCSDRILFTSLLNLPALKNAKRYLTALDSEGIGADKVKLVINRHIPKDEIRVVDAEKVLNTRAYLTVPNAYADVKTSINKGVPLVMSYPRSPVTMAMNDLAGKLMATI